MAAQAELWRPKRGYSEPQQRRPRADGRIRGPHRRCYGPMGESAAGAGWRASHRGAEGAVGRGRKSTDRTQSTDRVRTGHGQNTDRERTVGRPRGPFCGPGRTWPCKSTSALSCARRKRPPCGGEQHEAMKLVTKSVTEACHEARCEACYGANARLAGLAGPSGATDPDPGEDPCGGPAKRRGRGRGRGHMRCRRGGLRRDHA